MSRKVEHCYSFVIYGDVQRYFRHILLEGFSLKNSNQHVFCVFVESEEVRSLLVSNFDIPVNYVLIVINDSKTLSKLPMKLVRYFSHRYIESEFYHVRDADHTNINQEKFLLELFSRSRQKSLIVRSSSEHLDPISAGLFSYKKSFLNELDYFQSSISNRIVNKIITLLIGYRYDQVLLGIFLYPKIRGVSLILSNSTVFSGEDVLLIHSDYLSGWRD